MQEMEAAICPNETTGIQEKTHQGRAVKHLLEILQLKKGFIAIALDESQQSVRESIG